MKCLLIAALMCGAIPAARADGPTGAQLNAIMAAGASTPVVQALSQLSNKANGVAGLNASGQITAPSVGDISAARVTTGSAVRTSAAIAKDRFNVMNYGAAADGVRSATIAASAVGATTLHVAAPTTVTAGQLATIPAAASSSIYGAIPSGATVTAVSVSGSDATITLSKALTVAMPVGSVFDTGTDNTAAFTAADTAAAAAGGGTIWAPAGSYFVHGGPGSGNNNTIQIDPGAQLLGDGNITGNYAGVSSGSGTTMIKSSNAQRNDTGLTVNLNLTPQSSPANNAGFEKTAYKAWVEDGDPSTLDGSTWYTGGHDAVGFESIVNSKIGNMFARIYGAHMRTVCRAGSDCNSWVVELENENDAPTGSQTGPTYTPQENYQNHKGIIHIQNAGAVDITSGIEVDGGGGAGKYHAEYEAMGRGIRADGYGFVQFDDPNNDLTGISHVLFGTDAVGNVATSGSAFVGGVLRGYTEPRTAIGSNYTIQPGTDCGTMLQVYGAATITVPALPSSVTTSGKLANGLTDNSAGASVTRNAACRIRIVQSTTGTVTLAAGSGMTLYSTGGLTLAGKGAAVEIEALSASLANVSGDLAAPVSTQSAAYSLATTDCGTVINDTGTAAHNITIPTGLGTGCHIGIIQSGTGAPTVVAASGVTLEAASGAATPTAQYARISVHMISSTVASVGPGL